MFESEIDITGRLRLVPGTLWYYGECCYHWLTKERKYPHCKVKIPGFNNAAADQPLPGRMTEAGRTFEGPPCPGGDEHSVNEFTRKGTYNVKREYHSLKILLL